LRRAAAALAALVVVPVDRVGPVAQAVLVARVVPAVQVPQGRQDPARAPVPVRALVTAQVLALALARRADPALAVQISAMSRRWRAT